MRAIEEPASHPTVDFPSPPMAEEGAVSDAKSGFSRMHLRLQLQSMDSLLDVVVTVSRVGAGIESFRGADGRLELVFTARNPVAKRLPSLLRQVITVIAVDVCGVAAC